MHHCACSLLTHLSLRSGCCSLDMRALTCSSRLGPYIARAAGRGEGHPVAGGSELVPLSRWGLWQRRRGGMACN
ncbi:hypothetical protein PF005_g16838 [Phytophthora fragariae]|uniref:Secreted protein n=2 Tax=Phytophthora TaxID=4783 RepID=A0A6A3YDZ7_9STRA|nr:hypothetical protein PF003_g32882 [Phytophthora fragariae]KAE9016662.1 hypothetical protein PR002_g13602 [Phytophthora rubi]KAE8931577.1 hypothetical protein PF009_g18368 [Phytophthora fragariae]KAE8995381.1 hypothetical protein PF011_g16360 [Phytophthora fragariae]KAE9021833.1 hypothetical protein PR001_g13287 [Phytophthora rubi]